MAAAETIRQQDSTCLIQVIGDEAFGYYSRPALAFYLTGEISESQLSPLGRDGFRQIGVQQLHGRVVCIHPQAHRVSLQNGQTIPYDRLLIATGARATRLQISGSQAEGVVKLDKLDDARRIIHLARKARRAVVVGGGITALELVEGLVARGVKTHYFLRGERYWSNVLDETESRIIEHRLIEEGVQIHYHTELEEILVRRGRVAGVLTKDGRQIPCDILAVAVGVRPRIEMATASGIHTDRGIVVDAFLQTDQADIYAAGDVAQVTDPLTGESVLNSLWGPARQQGTLAGRNMTGTNSRLPVYPPINVTRLANLTTTIVGRVGRGVDHDLVGIARGDSETWRRLPDAIAAQTNFDVNRLRVLVGDNSLLGALVMGDQTLSRPLQHLVEGRLDISPIRDQLLKPGAPIADIIAAYWVDYKRRQSQCAEAVVSSGWR